MGVKDVQPIFLVFVLVLHGFEGDFLNLPFSHFIGLIDHHFLIEHEGETLEMGFSFGFFSLELFHELVINFGRPVSFLMNASTLLHKDLELLPQMLELLLQIEFSLVIHDLIALDSFCTHGVHFLVPLGLLKLELDVVELLLHGGDFIVALVFVALVLVFDNFVFLFFLFEQVDFGFVMEFLFVDSVIFFSDYSEVFMGSTVLKIVGSFFGLFSEFGELPASNEGEVVVFNALSDGSEGGEFEGFFGVVGVFGDGVFAEVGGVAETAQTERLK